jgi:UDP-glucose/iron transport system permease protein
LTYIQLTYGDIALPALLVAATSRTVVSSALCVALLGWSLGNTMTGVSLGLDVLNNGLVRERAAVEACLAPGVTRYQALLPIIRDALRSGFMPTINGNGRQKGDQL